MYVCFSCFCVILSMVRFSVSNAVLAVCRHYNAMECGRQRSLLARATTRMQNMHLRYAFEGWMETTHKLVDARSQATRICQQLLSWSVAKSFRAWHEQTQTAKMSLWQRDAALAQALCSWQALAATNKRSRAAAYVLFNRVGKMELSRVRSPSVLP